MNSLLTLTITDRIYRNQYIEERHKQIIKFSMLIILFRVLDFLTSFLENLASNKKISSGNWTWLGCLFLSNIFLLLISLRFKKFRQFYAPLQVLIFVGSLGAFTSETISDIASQQKSIDYGFYVICTILLNMSWIFTTVTIMINLIGTLTFMMLHDNNFDASFLCHITLSSFFVICAIYYSEKLMKESFLRFKQNENLSQDLNKLLLNLPQPLLLLDENNQEAVFGNQELFKLLSIKQDQGAVEIQNRLSQKILEPYNYIVGLGDEEQNKDSNSQVLESTTTNTFQQKFDIYETIQNNQSDSYYSLDTTLLYVQGTSSLQRKNQRNLNSNQKIESLENDLQQGSFSQNPEVPIPQEQTSDTQSKDKIYKEIVSMKVQNLHFQHRDLKMVVFNRITSFVNNEKSKMENNFIEMITATISHDMLTPINSITGLIQTLEKFIPEQEGQKVLSVINNSSKILLFLVNDILDYFQIKHGLFKVKTLSNNIQNTVTEMIDMYQLFALEKKIVLKAEFDSSLPTHLYTDNQRIQQILNNLLQNALKFTTQGSVKILVSYNRIDELVNLKVVDTGVGIKPAEQQRLFKLFGKFDSQVVVNNKGIGLGLNICKKIVKECGGDIFLESSYTQGAQFCFSMKAEQVISDEMLDHHIQINQSLKINTLTNSNFQAISLKSEKIISCDVDLSMSSLDMEMLSPIKIANFKPYTTEPQFIPKALFPCKFDNLQDEIPTVCFCKNKSRILIVDDNIFNIITLQTILEKQFNLQVDKATNGQEAVDKVIERYNQNQSGTPLCSCNYSTTDSQIQKNDQEIYKVIFMDCNMPIMDGFESTKQIRKLQNIDQSDMKIIALTANTNQSLQDQCFESGMDQFLSKPLESHLLRQVLIDNSLYKN
eukprot:403377397